MNRSPSPTNINVRSIISIFENQSSDVDNEPTNLIRRTKSMGSLVQRPQVTQRTVEKVRVKSVENKHEENLELTQIDQQIQHLQNKLSNSYKTYSKENHIYYQNQIIFILTDLINIETRDNNRIINKKSEMTETLKRLNMKLNAILPTGGHKNIVTTSTPIVRTKTTEEKIKHVAPPPRKEQQYQKEVEVEEEQESELESEEEIPVSVRSLKEKFEANSNESEGKREFGPSKVTRQNTFNSIADLKYVTYSEKFITTNSFDAAVENSFPSQVNGLEDEIQRDRDSDSFSEQSASSEDEEGQNGLENQNGEN